MTTKFNSFDESRTRSFIESPLGARNISISHLYVGVNNISDFAYTVDTPTVRKYDSNGFEVTDGWPIKTLGSVRELNTDDDGNLYIVQGKNSFLGIDNEIFKYNKHGQLQWAVEYPGPGSLGLFDLSSGHIYIRNEFLYITARSGIAGLTRFHARKINTSDGSFVPIPTFLVTSKGTAVNTPITKTILVGTDGRVHISHGLIRNLLTRAAYTLSSYNGVNGNLIQVRLTATIGGGASGRISWISDGLIFLQEQGTITGKSLHGLEPLSLTSSWSKSVLVNPVNLVYGTDTKGQTYEINSDVLTKRRNGAVFYQKTIPFIHNAHRSLTIDVFNNIFTAEQSHGTDADGVRRQYIHKYKQNGDEVTTGNWPFSIERDEMIGSDSPVGPYRFISHPKPGQY